MDEKSFEILLSKALAQESLLELMFDLLARQKPALANELLLDLEHLSRTVGKKSEPTFQGIGQELTQTLEAWRAIASSARGQHLPVRPVDPQAD